MKVVNKFKDSYDFNIRMEVEVLEIFNGQENRKKIIIWGDDGNACRPYIDHFEIDCTYYLSLFKFNNDYEQMNCGEMYLHLDNGRVIGEKDIDKAYPQVGEMNESDFESRLKIRIK